MKIHRLMSPEARRVVVSGAATLLLGGAITYMANARGLGGHHGGGPSQGSGNPTPFPLKPDFPADVDIAKVDKLTAKGDSGIIQAQRLFDTLSWQTFLGLNWPTNSAGKPLPTIAAPGPRAWDFLRNADTIFLEDGSTPEPWSADLARKSTLATKGQPIEKLFRAKAAESPNSANENTQAFSGPMVDQNGNWVRYEVLVNRPEFEYIRSNALYNLQGQAAFSQRYSRSNPQSNVVEMPINHGNEHGAIEIKLAWKQMGPGDDRSRFYRTMAVVNVANAGKTTQKTIEVGLVGMHLAMHTASSPQWIWATFEQVDNCPDSLPGVELHADPHAHYNFNNPKNAEGPNDVNLLAPTNAYIDANGNLAPADGSHKLTTWIEGLTTTPTQATRLVVPTQPGLNPLDKRIYASTASFNKDVQAELRQAGSVFQYYKLITTQWPVHPDAAAYQAGPGTAPQSVHHKATGDMVPTFLVNSTMETFFQKGLQNASNLEENTQVDTTQVTGTESCTGCHYSSGICVGFNPDGSPIFGGTNSGGFTGSANFSWLMAIEAHSHSPINSNKLSATQSSPVTSLRSPGRFLSIVPKRGKRTPAQAAPNP